MQFWYKFNWLIDIRAKQFNVISQYTKPTPRWGGGQNLPPPGFPEELQNCCRYRHKIWCALSDINLQSNDQTLSKSAVMFLRNWRFYVALHVNFDQNRLNVNPRPHMLFSILERTWGGGCNPPCHFAPNWDRTVGQRPNESLGCCESNDTRVDLFRSYLDPSRSGQRKKMAIWGITGFRK